MAVKSVDVLVLGGGPAGMATALSLARLGLSAVVIERSCYELQRIGETLPPEVRFLLGNLGVWEQFLAGGHLPAAGIRSAWGGADTYENEFIFNPYGMGWHLDRVRFDAMLAREAERLGVMVCRGTRMLSTIGTASGGWELEAESGGKSKQFHGRFFVDASGRASTFACKQGAKRVVLDHLVGVIGFFSQNSKTVPNDSFTLLESIEEGWWYSALLPDHRMVVALMTDADLYARGSNASDKYWHGKLAAARQTQLRLRGWKRLSALQIVSANTSKLDRMTGENWLAVGDTAMAFDPLSSQGVYKALHSGIMAGQAICRQISGDETACSDYTRSLAKSFERNLVARTYYYSQERRWPDSIFWTRRTRHTVAREAHSLSISVL